MIKLSALAFLLVATFVLLSACGSAADSNANANIGNAAGIGTININGANLPPGISNSPIIMNGNQMPGGNAGPGATPTPGIPHPANIIVKPRPGATATPGIPSPEELRRQLQRPVNAPPPAGSGTPSIRSTNANSPRTVRKP